MLAKLNNIMLYEINKALKQVLMKSSLLNESFKLEFSSATTECSASVPALFCLFRITKNIISFANIYEKYQVDYTTLSILKPHLKPS